MIYPLSLLARLSCRGKDPSPRMPAQLGDATLDSLSPQI